MMRFHKVVLQTIKSSKAIISIRHNSNEINPAIKTWRVLTNDLGGRDRVYPEHADVVIIGGGFIGAAVAYWLKSRAVHGLNVVVLEKDINFKEIQRNVSLGSITQHYSLEENIQLSQFSAEFMRNVQDHLGPDVDIKYKPTGSLVLASEQYADRMENNVSLIKELGTRMQLLNTEEIAEKFPWINTSDVKLGCMGFESEGSFDAWALHKGFLKKSLELGADYVNAEVTGFEMENVQDVLMEGVAPGQFQKITRVIYKTPDGEEQRLKFAACVLAAGDQSETVARFAKVGIGEGILEFPLPVQRREYKVYSIENKALETGLSTPIVTDTSGLWIKRNGLESDLLFGMIPPIKDDHNEMQDDDYYNNVIHKALLNRMPSCSNSNITCVTTEMHDCNTYDNTGILGLHPYHNNLYLATGFGKQGCQHAPGIGRAIAELIINSRFVTIDFTRFGFDRFITSQPIVDLNVY